MWKSQQNFPQKLQSVISDDTFIILSLQSAVLRSRSPCSSHLRVILIIIMVFLKDISLACFFNKWSLFLWFGCWGSGRICVPKGHPDCLAWGLELCPCSPAACGLAAFLFITSIVGVTESSSV